MLSLASLANKALPSQTTPVSSAMASLAAWGVSNSTKANPRERPVSLSSITFTERYVKPSSVRKLLSASVRIDHGRFPTNTLFVMD